jgi:hypothetical protein
MKIRLQRATLGVAILITGAVIVGLTWASGPLAPRTASAAHHVAGSGPPHANPVFARNVTGTWAEIGGGGGWKINIHADGTFIWDGSWFFGSGTGNSIDGQVYGTWMQTGPYEMTSIQLGFLFEGDGTFWGTGRVKEIYTFSPDFQTFTYVGWEDVFSPDQDPTDPDAEPFVSFSWQGGPTRRLNHNLMD